MVATNHHVTNVRQRAAVYALLARLWGRELSAELLAELQQDELRKAYETAGGFVPQDSTDEVLDQLTMDYCQLFLGPSGHLPPYQSVWSEGRFEGVTTTSLREYVEILNDAGNWSATNPLDHLSIQLDMMAYILNAQAETSDDVAANREAAHHLAMHFFHDHIGWAIPLCQAAQGRSESEFYRQLSKMTGNFIEDERTRLDSA